MSIADVNATPGAIQPGLRPASTTVRSRAEIGWLTAGVIALLAFLLLSNGTVLDDAYITYRFARNLHDGYGLVWNPDGERTEGFSSPLHLLLSTLAIAAGWDPLLFSRVLSVACIVGSAVLARRMLSRVDPERSWIAPLVWPLVLGNGLLAHAAMFGLETLLFVLLLTSVGCLWWFWSQTKPVGLLLLIAVMSLLCIVCRPEASLWLTVFAPLQVGVWVVQHESRPSAKTTAWVLVTHGVVLMGGAGFMLWKYRYFGGHLPNPYYIKAAGSWSHLPGLSYVVTYVAWGLPLWIGLAAAVFLSRCVIVLALCGATAVLAAYYLTVNPLMGTAFRFLLPTWPLLSFCALIGMSHVAPRLYSRVRFAYGVRLMLVGWLVLWCGAAAMHVIRTRYHKVEVKAYESVGRALAATTIQRVPTIATVDQGALPYFSKWNSLDFAGLTTNQVAWARSAEEIVNYILGHRPDVISVRRLRTPRPGEVPIYNPHARTRDLLVFLWHHPDFRDRFREVGAIPAEDGEWIAFYVDEKSPSVAAIEASLRTGIARVPGSFLAAVSTRDTHQLGNLLLPPSHQ